MIILSKEAGSRIESGRELVAGIGTHKQTLSEKLHVAFPAEAAAQIIGAVEILGANVEVVIDNLAQKEHAHSVELSETSPARARRATAVARGRDDVKALTNAVDTGYGREGVVVLGLDAKPPTRAVDLHRFCQAVVHAVRTRQLPPARFPGAVDISPFVAQVEADITEIGESMAEVTREVKEDETTLLAKHEAMDLFDRTFTPTAHLVAALFTIVGDKELSQRIRPSGRRPGRTVGKARELAGGQHVPEDELLPVPDPVAPPADPVVDPAAGGSEDVA